MFPYICINVFLLICFCSVYVIRLFGWCSRLLDPALDTSPLNWNIISFTVNFHYMYYDHCLSWIVISKKIFLLLDVIVQSFMVDYFWFPTSFLFVFLPVLVVVETIHKHIAIMNIIIWQGKSQCSDWFFLGQDFAIHTISMKTVISCVFFVFES